MEKVDTVIIGAGAVGLAVAREIGSPGRSTIVVERNPGFGWETSSHNSEVKHAGIYFSQEFLKTRLCLEGKQLLYEFCARHNVPHKRVGKLIVAAVDAEIPYLEQLASRGTSNGVEGLALLEGREACRMEPNIRVSAALHSPSTGIMDTHQLMKCLEAQARDRGVIFAYNCALAGFSREKDGFELDIRDADGSRLALSARFVVNAAGLGSEQVARMAGIDTVAAGYELHCCKGEYFRVRPARTGMVSRLVYPTPTEFSLGIHTVVGLDGHLKLGPNAFYVDRIDYDVDASHAPDFYESARRFLPFLGPGDLSPDMAGIRPKLQKEGGPPHDFVIAHEAGRGLPGLINLIGIESPGLTACLAIARHVAGIVPELTA